MSCSDTEFSKIIISHFQTSVLLNHRADIGKEISVSLDLGKSNLHVQIDHDGVVTPEQRRIPWKIIEQIDRTTNNCFSFTKGEANKVVYYSELTGRVYSLYPTKNAPTMLVSGIPMHRIKGTTPDKDTEEKINVLKPVHGHVLDTSTGLGYTASLAAENARQVITIELEPAVLKLARQNPWSRELFGNEKISIIVGDSSDIILNFSDQYFDVVIHDPPAMNIAGELYSQGYYAELFRIIKKVGKLFHYIGDPNSRTGSRSTSGVVNRLRAVGFNRVVPCHRAFGVLAFKK